MTLGQSTVESTEARRGAGVRWLRALAAGLHLLVGLLAVFSLWTNRFDLWIDLRLLGGVGGGPDRRRRAHGIRVGLLRVELMPKGRPAERRDKGGRRLSVALLPILVRIGLGGGRNRGQGRRHGQRQQKNADGSDHSLPHGRPAAGTPE